MNEFNVLLAAATNGTPSGSLFDALFARYIAPQESWRELESPLPITILTAGEDLIDYRIYGNTENGESVGKRTENLFDSSTINFDHRVDGNGYIIYDSRNDCSDYIEVESATYYHQNGNAYISEYDANKGFVKRTATTREGMFKTSDTTKYIISSLSKGEYTYYMIIKGQNFPSEYIPYGYKLPMVVTNGTATTTTPIYIGSDPLAEDEYVDFGKQKIYRMEGGTLTPTDPPVPIPALPTIEGETIIDYNPSTTPAVEPEKMYIKYKP